MPIRPRFIALSLICCAAVSAVGQQAKKKIENAEQLPVYSYAVPGKASALLTAAAAFKVFIAALEKDLENDLENYDIEDKTTLKKYSGSLLQIAILQGRYSDALSYLRKRAALEDKPAAKAMAGLLDQPLIDAKEAGGGHAQLIFEAEFKERLQMLPYEVVQNELKEMKSGFETISPNLAGDEASFTSFGKIDVYADGYEVDSVLPGGDHQSWSGTSMASPQVTNLAAKLFAKYPQLTDLQVKKLIVDGSDEKEITGRRIRLLNEQRSFELASQTASVK
jgi:Subtilase family